MTGRKPFCKFEYPGIDHFAEQVGMGVSDALEMIAIEDFLVAHCSFACEVQHVIRRKGANGQFQPTVVIVTLPTGVDSKVISANTSSPAAFSQDGFDLETREMICQALQAALDVLGQFSAMLSVSAF